jgi:hypothetical protein
VSLSRDRLVIADQNNDRADHWMEIWESRQKNPTLARWRENIVSIDTFTHGLDLAGVDDAKTFALPSWSLTRSSRCGNALQRVRVKSQKYQNERTTHLSKTSLAA